MGEQGRNPLFIMAAFCFFLGMPLAGNAQAGPPLPGNFGTVHFPVTCTPVAQQRFDEAIGRLHSFFFPETVKAFNAVLQVDPDCAMAYWGLAISQLPNPLIGPFDDATMKRGLGFMDKAKAAKTQSPRERDYIAALDVFYRNYDKIDNRTRLIAYEHAMGDLYNRYPDDAEAAIFYALALNEAEDLTDKTYARQLKAAHILEKEMISHPNHPGVAHYIIHSYDYAPIASRGLSAALAYAKIAPDSPHAIHMPSHIFAMLGMWPEDIASNVNSVTVARAYFAKTNTAGIGNGNVLHPLDFLEYAYLQTGQDRAAKGTLDEAWSFASVTGSLPLSTALAAIPARYALERGDWASAAKLIPPSATWPVLAQWPISDGITAFARGLGAARSGDSAAARTQLDRLTVLRDGYIATKDIYWTNYLNINRIALMAWIARAEGHSSDARAQMGMAARMDLQLEKHVVMENRLVPMNELLGEMLLADNRPEAAAAAFENSLKGSPKRLRSLYGAAVAADLVGDRKVAKAFYAQILAQCAKADSDRPEIAAAKQYISQSR
jgi:hypothetical protein